MAQSQVLFECTPPQYVILCQKTLPNAGMKVIQGPSKNQGIVIGGNDSEGKPLGQVDFTYDGAFQVRFYNNADNVKLLATITADVADTLGPPINSTSHISTQNQIPENAPENLGPPVTDGPPATEQPADPPQPQPTQTNTPQ